MSLQHFQGKITIKRVTRTPGSGRRMVWNSFHPVHFRAASLLLNPLHLTRSEHEVGHQGGRLAQGTQQVKRLQPQGVVACLLHSCCCSSSCTCRQCDLPSTAEGTCCRSSRCRGPHSCRTPLATCLGHSSVSGQAGGCWTCSACRGGWARSTGQRLTLHEEEHVLEGVEQAGAAGDGSRGLLAGVGAGKKDGQDGAGGGGLVEDLKDVTRTLQQLRGLGAQQQAA